MTSSERNFKRGLDGDVFESVISLVWLDALQLAGIKGENKDPQC